MNIYLIMIKVMVVIHLHSERDQVFDSNKTACLHFIP